MAENYADKDYRGVRTIKNAQDLKGWLVDRLEAIDDGLESHEYTVDGAVGDLEIDVIKATGAKKERRFTITVVETTLDY